MAKAVLLLSVKFHLPFGFYLDLFICTRGMHLAFTGPLNSSPRPKFGKFADGEERFRDRQRERKGI
jgi:hypothetical protein